ANGIEDGSMDDFMNRMGLGDPDPSNYRTGFDGAEDIANWFKQDRSDDLIIMRSRTTRNQALLE
ncbi:MAG: hypothetical protein VXW22_05455, partial [Pseudomonadota bacterium]|nr:hypothetical protein [Pseudomonadota bacterium]